MKKNICHKSVFILLIIGLVIFCLGTIFYYWRDYNKIGLIGDAAGPWAKNKPAWMQDWKTYSDTIYGFSVSYPGNWSYRTPPLVFESPNKIGTTIPEYTVSVSVLKNPSVPLEKIANNLGESCVGQCPEEGGKIRIKGKDYRLIPPKIETKNINGITMYYVTTYYGTLFVLIPLPHDNKQYLYISPHSWAKNQSYQLFDQIISTFRFLK